MDKLILFILMIALQSSLYFIIAFFIKPIFISRLYLFICEVLKFRNSKYIFILSGGEKNLKKFSDIHLIHYLHNIVI